MINFTEQLKGIPDNQMAFAENLAKIFYEMSRKEHERIIEALRQENRALKLFKQVAMKKLEMEE